MKKLIIIIWVIAIFAMFLFSPIFYIWYQEYFELSDQAMFMPFMGMFIVLSVTVGGLIGYINLDEE